MNTFYILYSKSNNGFWNNKLAWYKYASEATKFSPGETTKITLSNFASDAIWLEFEWGADLDAVCPSTGDRHKPNWASVNINVDGDTYIDVSCIDCGCSGCMGNRKTLEKEICW